ncbi:thiamine-triphosphatase [Corythoichthys intestinalis]|uniref:thiamine-triphosphatase n=1 Tax=Corythoichthys intestinalis TaxID=161448 RepID=UPI0025A6758B|nr:thiamine-triphosphatase [Corythoichthys intestinalis]XP_061809772.1 thiamine-triphosphatase-like [Nerophis lumbriciformis]
MSIEVERKFVCDAKSLKVLEEIGVCAGQCQFQDRYFDTPQFDLTLRDFWLRQRKGCWELKCPLAPVKGASATPGEPSRADTLCTRYKEITNVADIHLKLKEVLKDIFKNEEILMTESCQTLIDHQNEFWASAMNLVCFAEFTTVRRTFTFEGEGVHVDLDEADFGYSVGEIEVLLPEGGDMQAALDKIERTAKKLGVTGDQGVDGKMSVYLQRNYPAHYARLLSQNIL